MSDGWHSKASQIASNVENRIALAFPFFKIDRLAMVIPTLFDSSVKLIFRFASMTSKLMTIIWCIYFLLLKLFHERKYELQAKALNHIPIN